MTRPSSAGAGMARSGTDERLFCVALAGVDPGPRRSKKPIRIVDQAGDPPVCQAIPNKSTFGAAADQPAVEQAAQMVRYIGLPEPCISNNFLNAAFARNQRIEDRQTAGIAEAPEELCPQFQGIGCRKIVLNVLRRHIIIH